MAGDREVWVLVWRYLLRRDDVEPAPWTLRGRAQQETQPQSPGVCVCVVCESVCVWGVCVV